MIDRPRRIKVRMLGSNFNMATSLLRPRGRFNIKLAP
jgi:hypothetical protein